MSRGSGAQRLAMQRHGCTPQQYAEITQNGALLRFLQHKHSAAKRSVEFKLSLWDWWCIWRDSGKWAERGQSPSSACMSRKGDVGPYAVGNVFISTNARNCSEASAGKGRMPAGVKRRVRPDGAVRFEAYRGINGKWTYLGYFRCPTAAHLEYLRRAPVEARP